jgi:hypothetical protein
MPAEQKTATGDQLTDHAGVKAMSDDTSPKAATYRPAQHTKVPGQAQDDKKTAISPGTAKLLKMLKEFQSAAATSGKNPVEMLAMMADTKQPSNITAGFDSNAPAGAVRATTKNATATATAKFDVTSAKAGGGKENTNNAKPDSAKPRRPPARHAALLANIKRESK